MEYTVTGIITAICDESGVVSFAIDGTPKSFCFSKRIFYTFGMPCEGSMANILDEGMEVQLYFEAHPVKKPRVTAVWLGNPPDAASRRNKVVGDTLNAVYDRKGRVSGWIDDDNFLIESEDMQVLASKLTMYRDGDLVDDVVLDEEIRFDAIPLEESHPSGALYEATCSWTGKAPSLVDRFSLNSDDDLLEGDLDFLESYELYGTVVVIPNDVVALVEVEFNDVVFEVMLFRDSFDVDCDRIQDVVDVGDGIFLRIKSSFIFSHCRQWIAVRAWRAEFELHDDPEEFQTPISNAMSTTMTTVLIFQMMVVGWMLSVAKLMFLLYNKRGVLSAATSDQRKVSLSIDEPSAGREHSKFISVQKEVGFRAESGDVLFPEADSGQEDGGLLEESAEEVLSKVCLDDSFRSESSEILFPEVGCGEDEAGPDAKTAGVVLHEVGSHLGKNCMAEDSVEGVSLGAESSEAVLSKVCSRQLNLGVDSSEEVVSEVISDHEDVSVSSEPSESLSEACSEGVLADMGSESFNCKRNNIRETNFALNRVEVVNSCPKKVLYSNPPLSGELWPLENDCGLITYEGVNIFVERDCFFVKGKRKSIKNFVTGRRNKFVNFEAILVEREKCGCRYVATCVWSETKPLVMVAAADLPAPNLALLQEKDKVFFGYVAKLCLPSFAMVIIPGEHTSVGVHVINFVDPLEEDPKKDALITDFVTLNDVVRFKIEAGSKVLRAYEVQKTKLTKEHWEESNAGVFVCHEIDRLRKALTMTL